MHRDAASVVEDAPLDRELARVKRFMTEALKATSLRPVANEFEAVLGGGKMLRARLTLRLGKVSGVPPRDTLAIASALEMIHAASLLHDDVIDEAEVRRGVPTVWVEKGVTGAILLGDLLVARAIGFVAGIRGAVLVPMLVRLTGEMCDAVAQQELLLRGKIPSWETCLDIARRKTGSLFAFAGYACSGSEEGLQEALLQAGYSVGTAYQLADDILDAYGDPGVAGKSLGTDELGGKITAVSSSHADAGAEPAAIIEKLCADSRRAVAAWPRIRAAWDAFLSRDLRPSIDTYVDYLTAQATS